jgi:2-methylaconitate cis-trans-isomerase PrpF
MRQTIKLPCVMMRGGTSRGPYFLASDLPSDIAQRDAILISVMGAGHHLEIDGIGGGNPVTSKVAIISPSQRAGIDVDYLFAQVSVKERLVDTSPNCGNMLAGVGPYAIEAGIVPATQDNTKLRIFNVNTGKVIEATIRTPKGKVIYSGEAAISGVPGTAAPILMTFLNSAGSKTGSLLPTGNTRDTFEGIEVSCVDAAMPVVLIRATDLGKTGYETPAELNADTAFLKRLETLRITAGTAMGITDVPDRVIPKPILLAPGINGTVLTARYFMPHECHSALAITGSVALASACSVPGTIAAEMCGAVTLPATLGFSHTSGRLDVVVDKAPEDAELKVSVVRTARRLFEGFVFAEVDEPQAEIKPATRQPETLAATASR